MSYIEVVISKMVARMEYLERTVARQAMQINNLFREGQVKEVDFEKGLAIIDAHGVDSKPVPWLQQAGSIVDWDPPSVGQRMVLISPGGDPGKGFLLPGGYTQQVPQPHQTGATFGRNLGGTKIFGTDNTYDIETGTVRIKANVIIEGNLDINGGGVKNNGTDIGDSHKHGGVLRGGALTDPPV